HRFSRSADPKRVACLQRSHRRVEFSRCRSGYGGTFLVSGNLALVAQPTRNALRAFSAITSGAWDSLAVPVDTGDTFLVDTNVALVAQPTQNQLRAYSAITGTWASLGVAVDTGDTFLVGGNTAFVAQPTRDALRAFSAIAGHWA